MRCDSKMPRAFAWSSGLSSPETVSLLAQVMFFVNVGSTKAEACVVKYSPVRAGRPSVAVLQGFRIYGPRSSCSMRNLVRISVTYKAETDKMAP